MRGAAIPYLRFVEVNPQILEIRNYNEDVLLLVMPTMTYSKTVLVMVRTKIIDKGLSHMTVGELAKATMTWRQAHFQAVMLGSLQLSHSSSDKSEMTKGATSSSQESDPVEVWKFQLNDVKGPAGTTQKVTILPFGTVNVWANTSVRGHCMRIHVLMEAVLGPQSLVAVVPTATYGELHLVPQGYQSACTTGVPVLWRYPLKQLLGRLCLPTKYHWWSTWPGLPETKIPITKRMGFGGFRPPRTYRVTWVRAQTGQGAVAQRGTHVCIVTWIWAKLLWPSIKYNWQTKCPLRSITGAFPLICMMMWRPISRKCWILVLSIICTVRGPVQWS